MTVSDAMETDLPLFGECRAYRLRGGRVVVHRAVAGGTGHCESYDDEAAFRRACPEIPPAALWRSRLPHGWKAGKKEDGA